MDKLGTDLAKCPSIREFFVVPLSIMAVLYQSFSPYGNRLVDLREQPKRAGDEVQRPASPLSDRQVVSVALGFELRR